MRTADPIPVGQWIHVAVCYDGSSSANGLEIFVDGQAASQVVVRDKLKKQITGGGFDLIMIGERFRDRGFTNGLVDQFQVYDRQLTSAEVRQLHDGSHLETILQLPADQLSPAGSSVVV